MEWSTSDVLKLIDLYRQFECLWNFKNASYKRTDLKNNAWLQISKELRKDISELKKKMKHLRTTYLAEKKKVECGKKSGSSTEFIYEPRLFYFDEMKFLDSVVILRRTTSNLTDGNFEIASEAIETDAIPEGDSLDVLPTSSPPACITPSPALPIIIRSSSSSSGSSRPLLSSGSLRLSSSPSPSSSPADTSGSRPFSKQKARREAKFNSAVDAIIASAKAVETENVFTSFAKAIALQLQQLPLADATMTMSEIHNNVTQKVLTHLSTSQQPNEPRDVLQCAIEGADISFD